VNATLLNEAERILLEYSPADFETMVVAAPETIEVVRAVEEHGAWKARYPSLEAFYAAHEARHPDIRLYAEVRREIETADPLTSPGGTIQERLARLRAQPGA
jgi:hypothetical protein